MSKYNINNEFIKSNPYLDKNLGYLVLGGSHAYGLNVEGSDVDVRGFFFDNTYDLLSVNNIAKEQVEDKNTDTDTDTVIFSLRKFVKLCLNGNPACLELLGVRNKEVLYISQEAQWLRENYKLFLSKKAYEPFKGFAGHLRKIYYSCIIEGKTEKANKVLMHCLRVLYTGRDLFSKQELVIYRPERDYLLEVRKGNYSKKPVNEPLVLDIINTAEEEFELAYKSTKLPNEPNYKKINNFVVDTLISRAGLRYE